MSDEKTRSLAPAAGELIAETIDENSLAPQGDPEKEEIVWTNGEWVRRYKWGGYTFEITDASKLVSSPSHLTIEELDAVIDFVENEPADYTEHCDHFCNGFACCRRAHEEGRHVVVFVAGKKALVYALWSKSGRQP